MSSNADFDAEMLELLASTTPLPPEAYPVCFTNLDGDQLEIVLSPEPYLASVGPNGLSEHFSLEDGRLVGFTVHGLSKRKPQIESADDLLDS